MKRLLFVLAVLTVCGLYFFPARILTPVANLLIVDDVLEYSDAVVVLSTSDLTT